MLPEGRQWMTVMDLAEGNTDFAALGADFEHSEQTHVAMGDVGSARGRLFQLSDAVAYAVRWISKSRAIPDEESRDELAP
jgi:aminoglycoside 3-N-acetyltransferase